jgi:rhombotail lipoprotein
MKTALEGHWVRLLALLMMALAGCTDHHQSRVKSSMVNYLYPKEDNRVIAPSIPVLKLPIKVGVAFVPEQSSRHWALNNYSLTEARKNALLERVAENFRQYDFVCNIEAIPSDYRVSGGSFANLDQIRTTYGVDIMALVSHDQAQFPDERFLSLTYWILVDAYVVSSEKNDTHTMLDTAVYDIASRNMLFRAPGTRNVKGRATPVNLSEALRLDSLEGFELATTKMIANLNQQLRSFRKKIKQNPEQVKNRVSST